MTTSFLIRLLASTTLLFLTLASQASDLPTVATAFHENADHTEVHDSGSVVKVLPDDTKGLQHQRFLVHCQSGPTILIAHDTSLAPRLPGLHAGDTVEFQGEYVWNRKGGLVHWTHRNTHGHHEDGWLRYEGRVYQ